MKVCYFGTYRKHYPRNQILIEGLRLNGVIVDECHEQLWYGIEDQEKIFTGGWLKPDFWFRIIRTYCQLIRKYLQVNDYDILLVGYPGHFDIFLARFLSEIHRKPLAWDVFNSLFLIATERGYSISNPLITKFIRLIEKIACRLPDMVFIDTKEFINWFKATHRINPQNFRILPIGADDRFFHFQENLKTENNLFKILYYGSYIPNHGVEYIVESAHLLSNDPSISFEMIGTGPDHERAVRYADLYKLGNIHFIPWRKKEDLIEHISNSDIILGGFGITKQATLTNNNKIYEGFALRKPVISGKSTALPEIIKHGIHLYLCERGSAKSLTEAILNLKQKPVLRNQLAWNGYEIFNNHFCIKAIGKQLVDHLSFLIIN